MKHICQGPDCHTYDTQSRVRGVKGAKVLRTRNARYDMTSHSWGYIWERYFCDERCLQNWLAKHMTHLMTVVGINTKPNETPVDVVKETFNRTDWQGNPYKQTDTTIRLLNEQTNDDNITA